ncbi:hypothetical protein RclHR1_00260002 [Rhizophagus clarus]|uniref:Uncharacterized protein n=1 Tax=Rhizophagus clarus TaxID=94130 RepID=A0A2Z6QZV1_9GLOM|nr:hypothetical protein RclHR1_00260002 [Rhizophagus clarus]
MLVQNSLEADYSISKVWNSFRGELIFRRSGSLEEVDRVISKTQNSNSKRTGIDERHFEGLRLPGTLRNFEGLRLLDEFLDKIQRLMTFQMLTKDEEELKSKVHGFSTPSDSWIEEVKVVC